MICFFAIMLQPLSRSVYQPHPGRPQPGRPDPQPQEGPAGPPQSRAGPPPSRPAKAVERATRPDPYPSPPHDPPAAPAAANDSSLLDEAAIRARSGGWSVSASQMKSKSSMG